ncbi:MAG: alpha/beta fold hydrolase [Acidobacteriaceae bacterium]|nr:alpha/beta fold hydrolase [Acidobacteriaceae bacterium]
MKTLLSFGLAMASLNALAQIPAAITSDPPPIKSDPALMEELAIASHGANLNGLIYVAEGAGPHPTVILLHGFPGAEQNLDLAQSIRRAGWNVIFFHYRGSWGSEGSFSFANAIDDTQTVIAWARGPQNAKKYRTDAQRIVLIGHSMGGFMAAAAGRDPRVVGIGMIAAWNIGANAKHVSPAGLKDSLEGSIRPLSGCTVDSLVAEMTAHKDEWDYIGFVPQLKDRRVLVVSADDKTLRSNEAFVTSMRSAGATRITSVHLPTDHLFNDHRIALQIAVLDWLNTLNP